MPVFYRALWTPKDTASLSETLDAVDHGDLLAALLAVEGATWERQLDCRAQIATWCNRFRTELNRKEPWMATLALSRYLGSELGLGGDLLDYENPRNSHISEVVSQREGLPIMLSCIWIIVGRSAGLAIEGIGLPGRFVCRVGSLYIDPYSHGAVLRPNDFDKLVTRLKKLKTDWRQFFRPYSHEQIVERVLRNLTAASSRDGDDRGLYRSVRFLLALRPQSVRLQLNHARLLERLSAFEEAETAYAHIIEGFPGTAETDFAASRLAALRDREIHQH